MTLMPYHAVRVVLPSCNISPSSGVSSCHGIAADGFTYPLERSLRNEHGSCLAPGIYTKGLRVHLEPVAENELHC